ncbi:uncharacterized protein L3040_008754 [Drepanopeziza brunnea f. sp. 'multigermtubi']|uniref:Uncharacterized protein n=1 Tax=Marssonina brunnea f. sp. multigermtubi (strain MB_m1) TaxID=1072389 RepID=K1X160_MARBU|nr:uncharacterized protein MBM_02984 [Drepanopeziza brunnea f. sp. 'multigermtubi' MB_m1]EKD18742.1 hypothetical protein MBM_02984 [Drepanopeziza brunnea f. sp. 'multigermtubi' MB_m1]KAJ5033642.1 hypothetical protein L3040_008754 [Drepanopeziza brunnea f. sp. 'multigermtubi']
MLRSKFIFAISLALSLLFGRAQAFFGIHRMKIIGYATAKPEQAERINRNHKITDADIQFMGGQIGEGFYLINEPGGFTVPGGTWHCVVKARTSRVERIAKVYIPRQYQDTPSSRLKNLWFSNENTIINYVRSMGVVLDYFTALRFSWVQQNNGYGKQMLIPSTVVQRGQLGLWAECFNSVSDMLDEHESGTIDWDDKSKWDIKGNIGLTRG